MSKEVFDTRRRREFLIRLDPSGNGRVVRIKLLLEELYMTNDDFIGQVVDGRFEIIQHIGDGGMGSVYLARQGELDRLVAVKLMSSFASSDEAEVRFEREGRALSSIQHENIAVFYHYGIWRKIPYIVMEYLSGQTLQALLQNEGALNWRETLQIAIQLCDGIAHAHSHQIIHRDLKPGNVIFHNAPDGNQVKVVDFGLARMESLQTETITQTGALVGSLPYMSPEQCMGRRASKSSDVYSLGCMVFQCISGELPFSSASPMTTLWEHVNKKPPRLQDHVSEVPQSLSRLIELTMAKKPADRPTASQLRDRFAQLLEGKTDQIAAGDRSLFSMRFVLIAAIPVLIICIASIPRFGGSRNDSRLDVTMGSLIDKAEDRCKSGEFKEATTLCRKAVEESEQEHATISSDAAWRLLRLCRTTEMHEPDPQKRVRVAATLLQSLERVNHSLHLSDKRMEEAILQTMLWEAQLLLDTNNTSGGESLLRKVMKDSALPGHSIQFKQAADELINCLLKNSRYTEAESVIRSALALEPTEQDRLSLFCSLACTCAADQDEVLAIQSVATKLMKKQPHSFDVLMSNYNALVRMVDLAIVPSEPERMSANQHDKPIFPIPSRKWKVQLSAVAIKQAELAFRAAVRESKLACSANKSELERLLRSIFSRLVTAYLKARAIDQARELLHELDTNQSFPVGQRLTLGDLFERANDEETAEQLFTEVMRSGKSESADLEIVGAYRLVSLYVRTKRFNLVEPVLRRIIEQTRGGPNQDYIAPLEYLWGEALFQQQKFADAIIHYKKALAKASTIFVENQFMQESLREHQDEAALALESPGARSVLVKMLPLSNECSAEVFRAVNSFGTLLVSSGKVAEFGVVSKYLPRLAANALRQDPSNCEIVYWQYKAIEQALQAKGRIVEAVIAADQCHQLFVEAKRPAHAFSATRDKALLLLAGKSYQAAEASLKLAQKELSAAGLGREHEADLLFQFAQIAGKSGRDKEAERLYKELNSRFPRTNHWVQGHFELAELYASRCDYESSIRILREVIESLDLTIEDRAWATIQLARSYMLSGQVDQADATVSKLDVQLNCAHRGDVQFGMRKLIRGEAMMIRNRFIEAIPHYEQALEGPPEVRIRALLRLMQTNIELNRYSQAECWLEKTHDVDFKNTSLGPWFAATRWPFHLGNTRGTLPVFSKDWRTQLFLYEISIDVFDDSFRAALYVQNALDLVRKSGKPADIQQVELALRKNNERCQGQVRHRKE